MKRSAACSRGQALVEFALILPLFLVLLFAMVEFGRAWMTKNIITGAAREAVRRYAVMPYDNSVGGEAYSRAVNILSSAGLDPARWNITLSMIDNNTTAYAEVSYVFPVIIVGFIPGFPADNIPLITSTTMRRE